MSSLWARRLWAGVILLHPFLFVPGVSWLDTEYLLRMLFLLLAVLLGTSLEIRDPSPPGLWEFFRGRPFLLLSWAYALWALFASFMVLDPVGAFWGSPVGDGAFWLLLLVSMATLLALRMARDPSALDVFLRAFLLGQGAVASLALYEVLAKTPLSLPYPASEAVPYVGFPSKGHLAGFLLMGAVLALYGGVPALGLLLSFVIGLTENRASVVGLFLAGLFSLLPREERKRRALLSLLALLSLVSGRVFASHYLGAGGLSLGNTAEVRFLFWKGALRALMDKPLFGFGATGYHQVWARYFTEEELGRLAQIFWGGEYLGISAISDGFVFSVAEEGEEPTRYFVGLVKVHNELLDQALLYGIPGALLFLLLYGGSLLRTWGTPLGAALLAYLGFLTTWYAVYSVQLALWILLALAMASGRKAAYRPPPASGEDA